MEYLKFPNNFWKKTKLGQCFRIKHGYAFKGEFFSKSGQYVLLTPGNFKSEGGIILKGEKEKYYLGEFPKEFLLHKDDLLVVMTDLTQDAPILGSAAFIAANDRYLHNQRLGKIVDLKNNELNPSFLYYLFNSERVRSQIRASATGSTVRHTAPDRIYEVDVELPSIPIQRKIASILSAYDDLIENNTRRIAILEEMAQSLYQEWFVHYRFPGYEKNKMVESELGMIPEEWKIKSFGAVADFINGFAFKPSHWGKMGKPIVKIVELKNGITDKTPFYDGSDIPSKYQVHNGDLLFSWSADLNVYIWSYGPALLNQHIFKIVPFDGSSKIFLFYSLKHHMDAFRNRSQGTTMQHIKRSALNEVHFAIPQYHVVEMFERNVEPILLAIRNLTTKNEILRHTRDLLLPRLISGEIDVEHISTSSVAEMAEIDQERLMTAANQ